MFARFLRQIDDRRKEFLLILFEDLRRIKACSATERGFAMVHAGRQHDYVLLRCIGSVEDVTQVGEVLGVTNGNQDVSRANLHLFSRQLRTSVHAKLLKLMML